jgi:hypothetical protein
LEVAHASNIIHRLRRQAGHDRRGAAPRSAMRHRAPPYQVLLRGGWRTSVDMPTAPRCPGWPPNAHGRRIRRSSRLGRTLVEAGRVTQKRRIPGRDRPTGSRTARAMARAVALPPVGAALMVLRRPRLPRCRLQEEVSFGTQSQTIALVQFRQPMSRPHRSFWGPCRLFDQASPRSSS